MLLLLDLKKEGMTGVYCEKQSCIIVGTYNIADICAAEKAFLRSLKIYTVEWYFDINQIQKKLHRLTFSCSIWKRLSASIILFDDLAYCFFFQSNPNTTTN